MKPVKIIILIYNIYLSEELIEYLNLKYGAILVKLGYSI